MKTPCVRNYFRTYAQTVKGDTPLWRAWRILKSAGENFLPVTDNNSIIGLLDIKDILYASRLGEAENLTAIEGMRPSPLLLRLEDKLEEAIFKLLGKELPAAVVVSQKGYALGTFSRIDALKVLNDFAKSEGYEKLVQQIHKPSFPPEDTLWPITTLKK